MRARWRRGLPPCCLPWTAARTAHGPAVRVARVRAVGAPRPCRAARAARRGRRPPCLTRPRPPRRSSPLARTPPLRRRAQGWGQRGCAGEARRTPCCPDARRRRTQHTTPAPAREGHAHGTPRQAAHRERAAAQPRARPRPRRRWRRRRGSPTTCSQAARGTPRAAAPTRARTRSSRGPTLRRRGTATAHRTSRSPPGLRASTLSRTSGSGTAGAAVPAHEEQSVPLHAAHEHEHRASAAGAHAVRCGARARTAAQREALQLLRDGPHNGRTAHHQLRVHGRGETSEDHSAEPRAHLGAEARIGGREDRRIVHAQARLRAPSRR